MTVVLVVAIMLLAITCLVLNSKIEEQAKALTEIREQEAQARIDKAFEDAENGVITYDEYDY